MDDVRELIVDHGIDILCLSETWLRGDNIDDHYIAAACPSSHTWKSFPRCGRRGGGLAFIYANFINGVSTSSLPTQSHESACISFTYGSKKFYVVCIYRPPNKTPPAKFLEELQEMILDYKLKNSPFILVGDFNYHFLSRSCAVRKIKSLLDECEITQHITVPTHQAGNVLDWVLSPTTYFNNLIKETYVVDLAVSDHKGVFIDINLHKTSNAKKSTQSRKICDINLDEFKADLQKSILSVFDVCDFESTIRGVLDRHAPLVSRTVSDRSDAGWFNKNVKQAKRDKRRAESIWRKSGLMVHREIFLNQKNRLNVEIKNAKRKYYNTKFSDVNSCKELYQLSNHLLGKRKTRSLPNTDNDAALSEEFSTFFQNKICMIREGIDSTISEPPSFNIYNGSILEALEPTTEGELRDIIMKSPSKYCDILDPLPTSLFKQCLDVLLPTVTMLINDSLYAGIVPDVFKKAIVKPLLKKSGLNENELKNYRPVSNLSFLSKILERIVLKRLLDHVTKNNLGECFQSAYKSKHSTETAVLKVCTDILDSIDKKNVCLLTLLDLSAAFDTIDHNILISRLDNSFGIRGSALDWFKSYLTHRTQAVQIEKKISPEKHLLYGVPQGSVLGPILFTMYTQPLSEIFNKHDMSYHLYADDSQLYKCSVPGNIPLLISSTEDCVRDVKNWMEGNKLKLNDEKTEVMLCGNPRALGGKLPEVHLDINGCSIQSSSRVKNLGVMLDSDFSMQAQVDNLCKNLNVHLKKIATIRDYLTEEVAKKLVTTFILSRLDYCNSLLVGISQDKLLRLQVIQNRAAKLVCRKKRLAHSLPILFELHWLPVKERINFKIALMCFKCLNEKAPFYLTEYLTPYAPSRVLRSSSDTTKLKEYSFNYKFYGGRSFQSIAPSFWNSLPRGVREAPSVENFKSKLKLYIFTETYL